MKITKRILPTVLMLVIGFFALQAQRTAERRPMDPEKMAEKQTARMTEQLNLDEKQAEQVTAINLKYAEQSKGNKEQAKAEREARKAERQQMQETKMAELKQVLTPEQYAEMEKAQAERSERRGGHGKGGKGKLRDLSPEKRSGIQTTKMVDKLGLNEEQAKALRQVNLDFAQKREAIFEQKKEERAANKETMDKLKEEQKAATEEILTPEQMKEWEEMKPERGRRHHGKRGEGNGRM